MVRELDDFFKFHVARDGIEREENREEKVIFII